MTVTAWTIRAIAPLQRERRTSGTALLATCAAAEAIAAGILLVGAPLPPFLAGVAALIAHGTAALVLCRWAARTCAPSRRWLSVAAVLAVPCLGIAVASVAHGTRGRDSATVRRRRIARRRALPPASTMRRLAGAPSLCDALERGADDQRRVALSMLSRRRDSGAIALLRWATRRDADVAVAAALVLDELGQSAERRPSRLASAQVRHGTG